VVEKGSKSNVLKALLSPIGVNLREIICQPEKNHTICNQMCHSRAGGNPFSTPANVCNGFPPARE